MVVDYYEFYFTSTGYNKPKEFRIIKHITPYIPEMSDKMSNVVFLTDKVEKTLDKLVKDKDTIRIKILLHKWLFAKEYTLIDWIPDMKQKEVKND